MLKTQLLKKIKENYFRYLKPLGFNELEDTQYATVYNYIQTLETKVQKDVIDLHLDLLTVIKFSKLENVTFNSDFTKKLQAKYVTALVRVENMMAELTPETLELIEVLKEFDDDSYVVGGACRDSIAQKPVNDIDFCTSISYDKLTEVFEAKDNFSVKHTGKQFLVLNVIHANTGETFEIAALRSDRDNEGAVQGTIEEDAKRRDFTNSAVYMSLKTNELLDPNGNGILDCFENKLQFIGSPKDRIAEDPLRVIRVYKFIKRGWEPTPKTLRAARENFEFAMKNVAANRVMVEMEKMVGLI